MEHKPFVVDGVGMGGKWVGMKSNVVSLGEIEVKESRLDLEPLLDHIRIECPIPGKVGDIYIPGNAKVSAWLLVSAVATGPDCKRVKVGDRIIVKAPAPGNGGGVMKVDLGDEGVAWFTKEDMVIAVVKP